VAGEAESVDESASEGISVGVDIPLIGHHLDCDAVAAVTSLTRDKSKGMRESACDSPNVNERVEQVGRGRASEE
jgi:hypothetical protein